MTDEMKMAIKLAKLADKNVERDECDRCYTSNRGCPIGYCRVNAAKIAKALKGKLK